MSPKKDNDAAYFHAKLAARLVPSPDRVFINDLHEPSAHVLEDPIQTHSNTNLAPGGSDLPTCPNPAKVLGGSDLGAFMATSLADITIMALDLVD